MTTLEHSPQSDLLPMELGQLTLFAGDTPASHSAQPGDEWAIKTTVTSGQKCIGSWTNCGPLGSLERMLLGTFQWASTKCFLTWKPANTPQGRLLFQLVPQTPRTDEIGSGLWPTPMVPNGGRSVAHVTDWRSDRTAYHNGKKVQVDLNAAVKMWPTPTRRDYKGGRKPETLKASGRGETNSLNDALTVNGQHGQLNPTWVEWLMGFPLGWTDLNHSETP